MSALPALRRLLVAAGLAAASLGAAHAQVILNDDFDTEHGGTGSAEYSGFANWSAANVDLLGPGYFGSLCQAAGGSSACLDMEGSGNGSLTTLAAYDLAGGTEVSFQFDLAGDQRARAGNQVRAAVTSIYGEVLFSEIFTLASDAPFQTFVRSFDIAADTMARFSFLSLGPADSMGMLLDNVSIFAGPGGGTENPGPVPAPVPEPSTYALMLAGLAGVGFKIRQRRRVD
jgi:hypothetical protein